MVYVALSFTADKAHLFFYSNKLKNDKKKIILH